MNKHSKFRGLMDCIENSISSHGLTITELYQVMLETLLGVEKEHNQAISELEADNQALRNELEALRSVPKKMAENAAECEEHFLGGYQSKEELDIFVHGMRTVASCMESYANKLEQDND